MSILAFRPFTRARLLRAMNSCTGIGVSVAIAAPHDDGGQQLEDVRLAIPLELILPRDETHAFRRRPGSVVWHSAYQCAAYPHDVPLVEQIGRPSLGMGCRECVALWSAQPPDEPEPESQGEATGDGVRTPHA